MKGAASAGAEDASAIASEPRARGLAVRDVLRRRAVQIGLCWLVAMVLAAPHLATPPARDEADAIVAAQAITQRGVPVFYQGDPDFAGKQITVLGHFAIPGLPGRSTVIEVRDALGALTWAENGGTDYKVGNWHPPLYVYLLSAVLWLPLPTLVALRLLNLLLLLASLGLLYAIADTIVHRSGTDGESLAGMNSEQVAGSYIPAVTCLAYVLISFGLRAHLLIEYTTTITPTAVLLFWYIHLRAAEAGWRGVVLRGGALALIAWANLSPMLPLFAALLGVPLLRGETRRVRQALAAILLGCLLFGLTFGAFSLFEGVPASATFAHSGDIVASALAILPHPAVWAHLGGSMAMELLLVFLYGPPILAVAGLVSVRRAGQLAHWTGRQARWAVAGAFALGVALAALYLTWQHVSVLYGLTLAILWWLALADMLAANWASLPFIWWLLPSLVCALVLCSARLVRWPAGRMTEMAVFGAGVAMVQLVAGPRAWGFPKYIAPGYGVLLLLAVLFLAGFAHGSVRLDAQRTPLAAGLGILALVTLIWLPGFACAAPDPQTGLCAGADQAPLSLWVSAFTAFDLLLLTLLGALATRAARATGRVRVSSIDVGAFVASACLALLLPLGLFAIPEQVALAHTTGSFGYDAGDINGIEQAGQYLETHVQPGQEVLARKEVMVFAPGVRFVDDVLLPADYLTSHPQIVWVARPALDAPGFVQVERAGAWGVYARSSPPAQSSAPAGIVTHAPLPNRVRAPCAGKACAAVS